MARPPDELGIILEQGAWGTLAPAIGSHPHAMLGAVSSTCDLYAFGSDKLLRVFNAKAAGPLRCSRLVLPQLLDESFVRRFPDFWRESPRAQADMVDEAHGGRPLDVPFAVLQLVLNERGTLVALVGRQRVAMLRLPPSTHADPATAAAVAVATSSAATAEPGGEVTELLARLGLGEYAAAFTAKGYNTALRDTRALHSLDADTRQVLISDLEMKPGHALALTMHLNGELPAPPASSAPPAVAAAAALPEETCFAVPLLPPPPPPTLRSAAPSLLPPGSSEGDGYHPASAFSVPTSLLAASKPGSPAVSQLAFHPLSESCLVVLYADGTLCVYDAARDLSTPETTIRVPPQPLGPQGEDDPAVSFSFGTGAQRGWASLALTLVSGAGRLYTVCPLLPADPREARPHLLAAQKELRACCASPHAAAWLSRQLAPSAAAPPRDVPSAAIVAVQGPLRVLDSQDVTVLPCAPGTKALALVTLPLPGLRPVHCVGLSDCSVLIVTSAQPTQPAWIGGAADDDEPAADGGDGLEPLLQLSRAHCLLPGAAPGEATWMSLVADPWRRGWVYVRSSRAEVHLLAMEWLQEWLDFLCHDDVLLLAPPAEVDPPLRPPEPPAAPPPREFDATLLAGAAAAAAAKAEGGAPPSPARQSTAGARGVVGSAVLSDPCIAHALLVLRGDGSAARVPLDLAVRPGAARAAASETATARQHEAALRRLAHKQPQPSPAQLPAELRAALAATETPTTEALELVEQAFSATAGRQSALSHCVTVGAQTAARLDAMLKRREGGGAAPPHEAEEAQARALVADLRAKIAFSSALQTNLDLRARALHQALRTPRLWPHAELSEAEREHVARLDALRDALHEVTHRLARVKQEATAHGGASSPPLVLPASAAEAEASAEAMDDAQERLAAQGAEIERLVGVMREARQHGDSALSLARRAASNQRSTLPARG